MKNIYVIMGEEDYGKALSEANFDDNFPVNPPCEFPALMIKIESMDPIAQKGPGGSMVYKVHRSWIGIPADALRKVIFPFNSGLTTPFGPVQFVDVAGRTEPKSRAEMAHTLVKDIMFGIRYGEHYKHMTHDERQECERAAATLEKWLMAEKEPPKEGS